ncbi:MAG: hypothetical protein HKN39_02600 [Flavobacteriales bacterium]|nr:hypothetical protein [Flavobacteriales bacterium]
MNKNAFQIIEPNEQPPENGKDQVMGSVKSLVLVLRFVQLFLGDYSSLLLGQMKSDKHLDNNTSNTSSNE